MVAIAYLKNFHHKMKTRPPPGGPSLNGLTLSGSI